MNGWDLFTWINCGILAAVGTAIFLLFLKDARGILAGHLRDADDLEDADPDRPE